MGASTRWTQDGRNKGVPGLLTRGGGEIWMSCWVEDGSLKKRRLTGRRSSVWNSLDSDPNSVQASWRLSPIEKIARTSPGRGKCHIASVMS